MKKNYNSPECEVVELTLVSVLNTSTDEVLETTGNIEDPDDAPDNPFNN